MDAATVKLHELLIRHAKGAISAWEEWLLARKTPYVVASRVRNTPCNDATPKAI